MAEDKGFQASDLIFALDIGTRSIIGIVGQVVDERLKVLAIEKEEHGRRAMLDGQIEDIDQVAKVARRVTERLEEKLHCPLKRVCVAAAGRALRTEQGHYALELPQITKITSDIISQLESGAVAQAEIPLSDGQGTQRRFYLVGYTVSGYLLDRYPMATLRGHNGQLLEADVVATFLPSEVVESLYAVMEAAGLEVASLTLEPIAALNAVIPAELRLLNLVLADIGAGTSDIAVCRDGAVVGYTMATTAGDEITEELMRHYLVDFATAEKMKMQLNAETISYRDVLGLTQETTGEEVHQVVDAAAHTLAAEIANRVLSINSGAPSALFLAGGGSKLTGLIPMVAEALGMDQRRVALAGNNYSISAFSSEYELGDPEYATPLGIAVSAGLGLISDSYRIMLNGQPAKLFRSGALTVLDLLMMNGYSSADFLGRTGKSLSVTVDGQRMVFRGESAVPCILQLNGADTTPSSLVYAGDSLLFTPAVPGKSAQRTLSDLLGRDFTGLVTINGQSLPLDTPLQSGDVILTGAQAAAAKVNPPPPPEPPAPPAPPRTPAIAPPAAESRAAACAPRAGAGSRTSRQTGSARHLQRPAPVPAGQTRRRPLLPHGLAGPLRHRLRPSPAQCGPADQRPERPLHAGAAPLRRYHHPLHSGIAPAP